MNLVSGGSPVADIISIGIIIVGGVDSFCFLRDSYILLIFYYNFSILTPNANLRVRVCMCVNAL